MANLEEERDRLAGVSEKAYKMRKQFARTSAQVHNFVVGPWFKLIVIAGVFGFLVFGVPMLGIYDYREIRKYTWGKPIYTRVTSAIRLVYPNLSYLEITELKSNEVERSEYIPDDRGLSNLTPDYVYSQLPNIGFDQADLKEVKEIYDRRRGFDREQRRLPIARAGPLVAFYFLFRDAEDAKRFLALRRRGLEKAGKAATDKVDKFVNIARRGNFVAIFNSGEEKLRTEFPQKRWSFKPPDLGQ